MEGTAPLVNVWRAPFVGDYVSTGNPDEPFLPVRIRTDDQPDYPWQFIAAFTNVHVEAAAAAWDALVVWDAASMPTEPKEDDKVCFVADKLRNTCWILQYRRGRS